MDKGFDINNVADILVRYHDGTQALFRGKGLDKIRKLMKASPPLQAPAPPRAKPKKVVIEESGSDASVSSEEEEAPPSSKKKANVAPPVNGGYSTVALDYRGQMATNAGGPTKGLSPHDIAKDMQRQATAISGIHY